MSLVKKYILCEGNYYNPMWSQTFANHQIKEYVRERNEKNKENNINLFRRFKGKFNKKENI